MIDYLRQNYPTLPADATSSAGPSILDLGTGNGQLLFSLSGVRDEEDDDEEEDEDDDEDGSPRGLISTPDRMHGVDYSPSSICLCQDIAAASTSFLGADIQQIHWKVVDMLDAQAASNAGKFDILLDKGTLDAIALASASAAASASSSSSSSSSPLNTYISHLASVSTDSESTLLLITSCNFTAEELIARITTASSGAWKHHETLPPKKEFSFGGVKGSTTCCVAFKRNLLP